MALDPSMMPMMQQDPSMMPQPDGSEFPDFGMDTQGFPGEMETEPPSQEEAPAQEENNIGHMELEQMILHTNLAKKLRNKKDKNGNLILDVMARKVLDGIILDEQSRADWIKETEEAYKLALLIAEKKTYPWPDASNVKYPLIATAAMQFSARAYPALVPSDGSVVKARAIPNGINSMFLDSSTRIARHMSWQLMVKDNAWEVEMDKLLMTLSVIGSMFKKTYYNVIENKNCSYIIYPKDFIVDYHATSLSGAYRKTEVIRYLRNQIEEKVRKDEEFLNIDYGEPSSYEYDTEKLENSDTAPSINEATPHIFYQCHTFYDLDEDGYEEPVVITIHKDTETVVNVTVRFTSEGISANPDGDIIRIEPVEYYTNFTFIENPIGSLYGIGFGKLLGPINAAADTLINMLIDGGTINNLQSGFLSKTLRLNMTNARFQPGEWKIVNATGEELKGGIYPLPTKEPSPVLLQLAQMLIQSGMQLASVAEIMTGKMPGQNTPAGTTQQAVEQSMAVFTAVYKRVYRGLGEEYRKLMYMNRLHPSLIMEEAQESGLDISPQDYALPPYSIIPGADPTGDSSTVKQQKFVWVMQNLMPLGRIDPGAVTQWGLEFMEIPNWQKMFVAQPPQQPPDPNMMKAQADVQATGAKMQMEQADRAQEREHKQALAALEYASRQEKLNQQREEFDMKRRDEFLKGRIDAVSRVNKARSDARERNMKSEANRQEMLAKFAENRAMHEQKMQQHKETKAVKERSNKKQGGK